MDEEKLNKLKQLSVSGGEHAASGSHCQQGCCPPPSQSQWNPKTDEGKKQKAMLKEALVGTGKNISEVLEKDHTFWDSQPMVKIVEDEIDDTVHRAIEPEDKEIRQDPYSLPAGFEWCDVDVQKEDELTEVYNLLYDNYVEDDDNMFRFDYSRDFLMWALTPPGYWKTNHIGVRVASNKKLVGFITGIPGEIRVYDKNLKIVEINFLCVHKKLRSKRLAPVLIKEVTRRTNLKGIFQAVYTAGAVLTRPYAYCRYYHRSLNPKKLIDIGFSALRPRMTMKSTIKLYSLPEKGATPGLRPLEAKDCKRVTEMLNDYLKSTNLCQVFTEDEVKHWMLPRESVVYAYVVEDPETKTITDFASFFCLASSILKHPKHTKLNAAYMYYYAHTKTPLKQLMKDMLIMACKNDFDVFNCLDVMENKLFLEDLKFGRGDGNLQYYVYNWLAPNMPPEKMGLVLL